MLLMLQMRDDEDMLFVIIPPPIVLSKYECRNITSDHTCDSSTWVAGSDSPYERQSRWVYRPVV